MDVGFTETNGTFTMYVPLRKCLRYCGKLQPLEIIVATVIGLSFNRPINLASLKTSLHLTGILTGIYYMYLCTLQVSLHIFLHSAGI